MYSSRTKDVNTSDGVVATNTIRLHSLESSKKASLMSAMGTGGNFENV